MALASASSASTFTVNSTSDPGAALCDAFSCSLRAAMVDANANPGSDAISFDIPGSAPHTIQPAPALPAVADPVTLDATTQPGFDGTPVVELDGSLAGEGASGLEIAPSGSGSTVRGLIVTSFPMNGITIEADSLNVELTGNSIHSNVGLGIDLEGPGDSGDGVTANDVGDGDTGANSLQNFPLLSSVDSGGGQTTVQGTLDTETGMGAYRLEFFSSTSCDSSGNGEGSTYLGTEDLIVDSSPRSFTFTGASQVAPGDHVTATATAPGGSTSEFSECAEATGSPAITNPGDQVNAEADTVSLQVQASAPNGVTLSYSATGLPPGLGIDSVSGLISGELGYASSGSYGALVSVSDGQSTDEASFDWTVTNTNRPPAADSQDVTTHEDTPKAISLNAADPDGDALSYVVVAGPAHGDALRHGSRAHLHACPRPSRPGLVHLQGARRNGGFEHRHRDDRRRRCDTARHGDHGRSDRTHELLGRDLLLHVHGAQLDVRVQARRRQLRKLHAPRDLSRPFSGVAHVLCPRGRCRRERGRNRGPANLGVRPHRRGERTGVRTEPDGRHRPGDRGLRLVGKPALPAVGPDPVDGQVCGQGRAGQSRPRLQLQEQQSNRQPSRPAQLAEGHPRPAKPAPDRTQPSRRAARAESARRRKQGL